MAARPRRGPEGDEHVGVAVAQTCVAASSPERCLHFTHGPALELDHGLLVALARVLQERQQPVGDDNARAALPGDRRRALEVDDAPLKVDMATCIMEDLAERVTVPCPTASRRWTT